MIRKYSNLYENRCIVYL